MEKRSNVIDLGQKLSARYAKLAEEIGWMKAANSLTASQLKQLKRYAASQGMLDPSYVEPVEKE